MIVTTKPLYIRKYMTSLGSGSGVEFVEVPVGTEIEFIGYGDESSTYSSDPVHANCYSGKCRDFSFTCKFLYKDPENIWSMFNHTLEAKEQEQEFVLFNTLLDYAFQFTAKEEDVYKIVKKNFGFAYNEQTEKLKEKWDYIELEKAQKWANLIIISL